MTAGRLVLTLYVSRDPVLARAAEQSLRSMLDGQLEAGGYDLEIIDVTEMPERVAEDDILATPTLVRHSPTPPQRLIGDLSDRRRLAALLGLTTVTSRRSTPGRGG